MGKAAVFLVFCLVLAMAPMRAAAHPHAWIDYRTRVVLDDDNKIVAIREHWVFDSTYTAFALHDFDKRKSGQLDRKLLMDLAAENLKNLKDANYFTVLEEAGKTKPVAAASDADSYLVEGRIALDFTLRLKEPADAVKNKVDYMIYDPSYYVAMLHDKKDPIALEGKGAGACKHDLATPNPNSATVSLASSIDKNGKSPDDLGVFFAQRMTLSCESSHR